MPRRPALAVFAAFLTGVVLSPWLSWGWPLALLLLLGRRVRSAARSALADSLLLVAIVLLGAGYGHQPSVALPSGPLLVEGRVVGTPMVLPGRVEWELQAGPRRLRAIFPAGLQVHGESRVTLLATARDADLDRLVVHAARSSLDVSPGLLPSLRSGIERTLRGRSAGRGLLRAVLIGDRSGLDPQLRRAFRNTGCAHLLSISGLHVGVILAWALWLGRRWRSAWLRRLLVGAALVGYVGLVGPRPPTLRAAVVAAVFVWAPGRGDPINRLSCAGLAVLLHDPRAVHTLGFLLSFGTVTALLLLAPRPKSVGSALRGVCGVFVASSLLLAVSLGHVPWVNLVLGVPCVALLGVILPLGVLGCAGALVAPGWGSLLLTPADWLSSLLVELVRAGAESGAWSWIPVPRAEWAALGLGAALLAGLRRKDRRPWRVGAAIGACALLAGFWPAPQAGLALGVPPRRSTVYVADGERLVIWGAGAEDPGRREQQWRSELGRSWRCVRVARSAGPLIDTRAGLVCVIDRAGVAVAAPEPAALLVILRRISASEVRRLLDATDPRSVWAPASLAPCFREHPGPVTFMPTRGSARLETPGHPRNP